MKIKKILQYLPIPLLLIGGYAISIILFAGLMYVIAISTYWVVSETIFTPSLFIYALDALILILIYLIFKSKGVRSGITEFWKQFLSNM